MAKVNLVDKQVKMRLAEIVKFQLVTHCFINRIHISDLDLDCLTYLGILGEMKLTDFCNDVAEKRLKEKLRTWKQDPDRPKERSPEASPQTIRNVLIRLEKEKLLHKKVDNKKIIKLNPEINVVTQGNILLNYKFLYSGS